MIQSKLKIELHRLQFLTRLESQNDLSKISGRGRQTNGRSRLPVGTYSLKARETHKSIKTKNDKEKFNL